MRAQIPYSVLKKHLSAGYPTELWTDCDTEYIFLNLFSFLKNCGIYKFYILGGTLL